jgi:hypothetical protein
MIQCPIIHQKNLLEFMVIWKMIIMKNEFVVQFCDWNILDMFIPSIIQKQFSFVNDNYLKPVYFCFLLKNEERKKKTNDLSHFSLPFFAIWVLSTDTRFLCLFSLYTASSGLFISCLLFFLSLYIHILFVRVSTPAVM